LNQDTEATEIVKVHLNTIRAISQEKYLMKVYLLGTERNAEGFRCYQGLLEADAENRERMEKYESNYQLFKGGQIGNAWQPVHVIVDRSGVDKWTPLSPPGDFPHFEGAIIDPVFSRRALDALADLLQGNGEILPLSCDEGEYYLFNTTRMVDAIDVEHTEFKPYSEVYPDMALLVNDPDSPTITRFAFHPEQVKDLTIFKISSQYQYNGTLVTDKFMQRVQEAALKGFEFELLWSSVASVSRQLY
jgi:hypothetical protein